MLHKNCAVNEPLVEKMNIWASDERHVAGIDREQIQNTIQFAFCLFSIHNISEQ